MSSATLWHECAVATCVVLLGSEMLMCPQHWRRVPTELKRAVYQAYHAWQRATSISDTLSTIEALRSAQAAAVAAVTR